MKLFIASDIHGSAYWCYRLAKAFEDERADKLLLLGDILYHGPRNDLPQDYQPKEVAEILNSMKDKILCIKGNCDSEVDQMMLDFHIMSEYALLWLDNISVYACHGHNIPENKNCDVLLYGHTHIPKHKNTDGVMHLNCGSVSIPKENSPHSYLIYENNRFAWKDLANGCEYMELTTLNNT